MRSCIYSKLKGYNKYSYRISWEDARSGDILEILSNAGIRYIELDCESMKSVCDQDENSEVGEALKAHGIKISDIATGIGRESVNDFSAEVKSYEAAVRFASQIGAEYIRVYAFDKESSEHNFKKAIASLLYMCDFAEKNGVKVVVTTCAKTFADTADNCREIMLALEGKAGLVFDVSEFSKCNEDEAKACEYLKGYIKIFYAQAFENCDAQKMATNLLYSLIKSGCYAEISLLEYINILPQFTACDSKALLDYSPVKGSEEKKNSVFLDEATAIDAYIEIRKRGLVIPGNKGIIDIILDNRQLPALKTQEEMLRFLLDEQYGHLPPLPDKLEWTVEKDYIKWHLAGKATVDKVNLTAYFGGKEFTFPFYVTIPLTEGKHPFFVFLNFGSEIPNRFFPAEEIVDNGFAVLSFDFEDVTTDDADFTNGLAGVIYCDQKRTGTSPGKVAMWAWAASRVLDYAYTLESLDMDCAAVCGHSRLGKTALLAAATDERFKFAISNNSGTSGAALTRGNKGESMQRIWKNFSFFFCENYKKYLENEFELPFDQHYLTAAIAPRNVYVASALYDIWADPLSEMLNCVAASEMYERCGKSGLVFENRFPREGDAFHEGSIGFHLRKGTHYLAREDWNNYMKYILRNSQGRRKYS